MDEDQKAFVDQLKYGQSFMLDGKRIDPKDIYMDKPYAPRLADALEELYKTPPSIKEAAKELRRLHHENQELRKALEWMVDPDSVPDIKYFAHIYKLLHNDPNT